MNDVEDLDDEAWHLRGAMPAGFKLLAEIATDPRTSERARDNARQTIRRHIDTLRHCAADPAHSSADRAALARILMRYS